MDCSTALIQNPANYDPLKLDNFPIYVPIGVLLAATM